MWRVIVFVDSSYIKLVIEVLINELIVFKDILEIYLDYKVFFYYFWNEWIFLGLMFDVRNN